LPITDLAPGSPGAARRCGAGALLDVELALVFIGSSFLGSLVELRVNMNPPVMA
jgi:hypothetical protein